MIVLMPSLGPKRRKKPIKRGSLLFFSSIAEMNKDDYINDMKKVLEDDELIYETILGDIYNESRVLRYKKYHYLKLSYLTLMVGIILTMIVFSVEHFKIHELLPNLP
ncbi:MAG: Pycsar system effector family protein [Verrucomicrobiota bacterium]